MLGINAVKGFEYGNGFDGASARGRKLTMNLFLEKILHSRTLLIKLRLAPTTVEAYKEE